VEADGVRDKNHTLNEVLDDDDNDINLRPEKIPVFQTPQRAQRV
jgi:hypothetical protein